MSVWMCVCQHRLSECSQVTIPSRGWACWSGNGVLEHRTADTAHWLVHPTCLHKLFNLESMRMCSIMTTSAGRYCKNPTSNGSTASRTALTTCHFLFFFAVTGNQCKATWTTFRTPKRYTVSAYEETIGNIPKGGLASVLSRLFTEEAAMQKPWGKNCLKRHEWLSSANLIKSLEYVKLKLPSHICIRRVVP